MKAYPSIFCDLPSNPNFARGEMAERSIAAVLKTVEGQTSGGSNPSLSAVINMKPLPSTGFVILGGSLGAVRGAK